VNVRSAEKELKKMLRDAGLDASRPDVLGTWEVFKRFASLPVEGHGPAPEDDLFLFQWGTHDWGDERGEHFEVDFLRQFTLYSRRGDYDHMEQLHCTFSLNPTPGLRTVGGGEEWSGPSLDHWFAKVEEHPSFKAAVEADAATVLDVRVAQEEI